ncbi:hypothetical protein [Paraburkholderia bonniea]|uniref:hypothetical protein n=1 Tax=Paraburkholderia bonniea TaxID=2152891 RepID=UPI001290935E|nr:hypothetical protein [Paraburkholderia bonniea]
MGEASEAQAQVAALAAQHALDVDAPALTQAVQAAQTVSTSPARAPLAKDD